jgi:hypothetical protein
MRLKLAPEKGQAGFYLWPLLLLLPAVCSYPAKEANRNPKFISTERDKISAAFNLFSVTVSSFALSTFV